MHGALHETGEKRVCVGFIMLGVGLSMVHWHASCTLGSKY